jgi:hypothetical protein
MYLIEFCSPFKYVLFAADFFFILRVELSQILEVLLACDLFILDFVLSGERQVVLQHLLGLGQLF